MTRLNMIIALGLILALPCYAFDSFDPGVVPVAGISAGNQTAKPVAMTTRVPNGSITLDGLLDEDVWTKAELAGGFSMFEPDRGGTSTQTTTFRVLYDDDSVYFGVACFDDPTLTSSALSRRDDIRNSDIVSIYIDPYLDRSSGYNFRVNPHGVLADAQLANQYDRDWNWNAIWDARVHRTDKGWFVEMEIPFSSIRYRPGDDRVWGFQIYRWMHGRGEDSGWTRWDRETSGFVSLFGTIEGFNGLKATRQLEVTPYVVGSVTDMSTPGADPLVGQYTSGLDLKYAVTADLTLNATFLPDFGQVEADPAVLNLSPFETSFEEKRPFFVEGSNQFSFPGTRMFYSRRIGTGRENSRIRFATKLTGKTAGDISIAALIASTDVTRLDQGGNPFEAGEHVANYGVMRVGKESDDGARSFHLMQTAVVRAHAPLADSDQSRDHRDGYATGADFEWNFQDHMWALEGSVVRSFVDPHGNVEQDNPDTKIGSTGQFRFAKNGGKVTGGVRSSWEHDQFDPNDAGQLFAPDEKDVGFWCNYRYETDGEDTFVRRANLGIAGEKSWLYAGHTGYDNAGTRLWDFDAGHHQATGVNTSLWIQTQNYWSINAGVWFEAEGTSRWSTRSYNGSRGPLMTRPALNGGWLNLQTDWRKSWNVSQNFEWGSDETTYQEFSSNTSVNWVQNDYLTHALSFSYSDQTRDAQWMGNFASSTSTNIGDVSYVFGRIEQQTWRFTWRSSVLFERDRSLELYLQPYLTVGDYTDPRELTTPDTYDFASYAFDDGALASDFDFSYASVNLNLVYRWEFQPGSQFFLVWTHGRQSDDERGSVTDGSFDNEFGTDRLFHNEPRNVFMTKLTYMFSI